MNSGRGPRQSRLRATATRRLQRKVRAGATPVQAGPYQDKLERIRPSASSPLPEPRDLGFLVLVVLVDRCQSTRWCAQSAQDGRSATGVRKNCHWVGSQCYLLAVVLPAPSSQSLHHPQPFIDQNCDSRNIMERLFLPFVHFLEAVRSHAKRLQAAAAAGGGGGDLPEPDRYLSVPPDAAWHFLALWPAMATPSS